MNAVWTTSPNLEASGGSKGRAGLARASTLAMFALALSTSACGRSSTGAVDATPASRATAVAGAATTVAAAAVSSTTSAAGAPAARVPSGTRESFALWLVDQATPSEQGRCVAPAVSIWQNPAGCYRPDEQAVRLGPDIIASSTAEPGMGGEWYVELNLTPEGLDQFGDLTAQAAAQRRNIAFELGGTVISAPTVFDRIATNPISLHGRFDEGAAVAIANLLNGR